MFGLATGILLLLLLCIVAASIFEFINGFHDTANAVATVIYTNSLRPEAAVVLSGFLNFLGVFAGGIGVAMGIVNLLPVDSIIEQSLAVHLSLILSILLTAIAWNLGTWYYGIPCSSSHTLIGSILGAGIAYSWFTTGATNLVKWDKAAEMGVSLLISPLFGFGMTLLLLLVLKKIITNPLVFAGPDEVKYPPTWIRILLILTCSGVSFSHGSNDGQKGVGLVLLILICFLPAQYALDTSRNFDNIVPEAVKIQALTAKINPLGLEVEQRVRLVSGRESLEKIKTLAQGKTAKDLTEKELFALRKQLGVAQKSFPKLLDQSPMQLGINAADKEQILASLGQLKGFTDFAPTWVIVLISLSLGVGTMIGWKRIVITIGEKIGKEHLTYAQGASSELVAASTIGVSTFLGLPVSTTHVLSSGIAGSMVATKGLKNLQGGTIRNIALAWVLTLPVCIFGAMGLFYLLEWLL
ncbi:MAG TPA: anion permease [Microscillaceae bacterium]|jgi:PiT family inorganic phosphate transporter|nr:anion permease [Microscillaceae bacterium]